MSRVHFAVGVRQFRKGVILHCKKPACTPGIRPSRAASSFTVRNVTCKKCKDTEAFEEAGRIQADAPQVHRC